MKITRDRKADIAYIEMSEAEVVRTVEINGDLYLDLDAEDRVVGLEVLNASRYLDKDVVQINIPEVVRAPGIITSRSVFG